MIFISKEADSAFRGVNVFDAITQIPCNGKGCCDRGKNAAGKQELMFKQEGSDCVPVVLHGDSDPKCKRW